MGLLQDVRFGFRMLAKNPWFTLLAVITIALGIGVNSAGFSIVNAVLWKKLPFGNSQEIVHLGMMNDAGQAYEATMSYPEFAEFRSRSHSFKSLAALSPTDLTIADSSSAPGRYSGAHVTSNLFSFLGIAPLRGRDFTPEDEKVGAQRVALIGYDVWQSRYEGRDDVVGSQIRMNGIATTVIGVMPRGMKFPEHQIFWIPLVPEHDFERRDVRTLEGLGRLAPGVSLEQSRAELKTLAQKIAADYPRTNTGYEPSVLTYLDWADGPEIQTVFLAMLGGVGFVLLIACANVANLLLSRVVQRSRETSIRTAVGASPWRIVRQLLVESVMLSFLGGFGGLLLAEGGIRWFDHAVADVQDAPYWIDFGMDYHVFAYFFFICVITGIVFGLMPALHLSRTDVNDNLKDGGRGTAGGFRARRTATALLVGEIALTVVLLVGAGLLLRSFLEMQRLDFAMDTSGLLTATIELPEASYANPADQSRFVDSLVERLKNLPGINTTITSSDSPVAGGTAKRVQLQDRNIADSNKNLPEVGVLSVDTGYFQALTATVVHGRDFSSADGRPGAEVAIVNEPFAAKYWPGQNPVGKRLRLDNDSAPWLEIIGVIPPVLQARTVARMPGPRVYVPYRQSPTGIFNVLMHGAGPRDPAIAALRAEVRNLDPDLPLFNVVTMDDYMRGETWPIRIFGTIFAAFAVMALFLSSIGLYGVTAYGITQRTQEIGVRMALGATPLKVIFLVLRQGLAPIFIGTGLGLLGALGVSDLLNDLLYGVTPNDPVTYLAISLLLGLVALIACLVPARRATRLNPVDALRAD